MVSPSPPYSRMRFGIFELDLRAGELRKSGVLLRLSPQPFKVLTLLMSQPSALVTREEFREEIWGTDTFVDFEHGLNFAIKKIRDTLGDDPETPRYIETLPRRGYRFIAPVDVSADADPASRTKEEALSASPQPSPGTRLPVPWRFGIAFAAVLALAAVMVLAFSGGSWRDRLLADLHLRSAPLPRIASIAVLPLEDLSRDPDQEYFADGLTDALITDLGKVATLRVISRTSVMRYKGIQKTLPEIGRELHVDAVVEGTVQRSGNHVRIRVQLVDARTDHHLWAESYERDAQELIPLEEQTAIAIAREVSGQLTPAQETRLSSARGVNIAAYDAYLHGRYLLAKRSLEPSAEARDYFQQALRADPNLALAYSGLADSYSVIWAGVLQNLPLAEEYARKAIALDPELAEGYASLGIAAVYQRKFDEGGKALQKAIELNPNYAMAHHWFALRLLTLGHPNEALTESDRAHELDPFSLPVNNLRGAILVGLREYDRAIEQMKVTAAIEPSAVQPHAGMAHIHWILGRVPEALEEQRKHAILAHDPSVLQDQDEIAAAHARGGLHAALLKDLQLKEQHYEYWRHHKSREPHVTYSAEGIANRYALLHDREKTLQWLSQIPKNAVSVPMGFATAPEFDFVRSDPRYHEVLRQLGIE